MLVALSVALALSALPPQGGEPQRPKQATIVRDSTPTDSTKRRAPRRLAVTAELLRTAFHDDRARAMILRARGARLVQDSSLKSYAATGRQRMSFGMGIGSLGRNRLMYRQESAFGVTWQRGVGARVELTGARVGAPMLSRDVERDALKEMLTSSDVSPVPYYPGQESLWLLGSTTKTDVDDRQLVHPLAEGAEAYYTYASGDSLSWTLPDRRTVRLREVEVRPRSPRGISPSGRCGSIRRRGSSCAPRTGSRRRSTCSFRSTRQSVTRW